jgi:predicted transcriptional regulator of viral defense system
MGDVILTRDLVERGFTTDEVARLERNGDLQRLRRGAYALPEPPRTAADSAQPNDAPGAALHRQLVDGTLPQLHPRAVLSHGSAAVLLGLPIFPAAVQRVHVTRDRSGGGVRRSSVHVHGAKLTDADVTVVDGLMVTSLARTVVDLARTLTFDQAVATGDRALALGLDPAALTDAVDQAARWPGATQARRVAQFVDGRSESVGESFSRVRCYELGLPAPELQFDVFDDLERFVGRTDFAWPELRTLGEFDGKLKYRRYRRPDESIEDAVIREKLREDALRDLGWQVVRWIWAELFPGDVIGARLRRAFVRGRR